MTSKNKSEMFKISSWSYNLIFNSQDMEINLFEKDVYVYIS